MVQFIHIRANAVTKSYLCCSLNERGIPPKSKVTRVYGRRHDLNNGYDHRSRSNKRHIDVSWSAPGGGECPGGSPATPALATETAGPRWLLEGCGPALASPARPTDAQWGSNLVTLQASPVVLPAALVGTDSRWRHGGTARCRPGTGRPGQLPARRASQGGGGWCRGRWHRSGGLQHGVVGSCDVG